MVRTRLPGVVSEGSSPSVPRAQFLSMYVLMKPDRQVICPNAPHTRWWYRHRMTGIEILAHTRETGESTGVTGPWQFWNPAGDMSGFLNYVSGSRTWPSLQALGSVLRVRLSFSWNITHVCSWVLLLDCFMPLRFWGSNILFLCGLADPFSPSW